MRPQKSYHPTCVAYAALSTIFILASVLLLVIAYQDPIWTRANDSLKNHMHESHGVIPGYKKPCSDEHESVSSDGSSGDLQWVEKTFSVNDASSSKALNEELREEWLTRERGDQVVKPRYRQEVPSPATSVSKHQGTLRDYRVLKDRVDVDVARNVSALTHFWRSTGFCPPEPHQRACEWFLSDDMAQNLAYIGAIPHGGVQNVRVHLLLDAVYVLSMKEGNPVYNFTCLDKFIKLLHGNGLRPGFELMGNPSNYFTDFENKTQVFQWKQLVYQIASRYMDQYGLGYVSQWNFESWNEPKLRSFDGLNFTYQGFLNYYDACSEGLKQASKLLRLGAPSGGCKEDYSLKRFSWVLLNHLDHGVNYFTGRRDVRVDYISVHKKGYGPNNSQVIMDRELHFRKLLTEHLPNLLDIPLVNDEADPLVTWSKPLLWRANPIYAGMVAKVIVQHQRAFFTNNTTGIRYQLLSNDNGFLSYQPQPFSQRTLLARFQVNKTRPPHVQFVRKPGHSVLGLLSLVGDVEVLSQYNLPGYGDAVGVLSSIHKPDRSSTQDSWQLSVLAYYSVDTMSLTEATKRGLPATVYLNVNIHNTPPEGNLVYVVYALDDNHGNPWQVWLMARSPKSPSHGVFNNLRRHEDPVRVVGPTNVTVSAAGVFSVRLEMLLPSVVLLHVCARAAQPPDQVSELSLYTVTCNQVLIVWSDSCVNSKCILRYDVEFSRSGDKGSFTKINPIDSIFTIHVYAPVIKDYKSCDMLRGFYRVRAVDYWDRPGPYSLAVHY